MNLESVKKKKWKCEESIWCKKKPNDENGRRKKNEIRLLKMMATVEKTKIDKQQSFPIA